MMNARIKRDFFVCKKCPEASGNQSGDVPAERQTARSSSLGAFYLGDRNGI